MIKVEVGFDGNVVLINGHSIFLDCDDGIWWVEIDGIKDHNLNLEQAIAYCLEN